MELSRRDFGSWSSVTIFMQGLCREKSLENLKLVFGKNRVFLFLSSGLVKLDETGAVLTMSPGTASLRPVCTYGYKHPGSGNMNQGRTKSYHSRDSGMI